MSFTHNDIDKSSEILGVPKNLIIDLLALEKGESYKLSKLDFHTINKNYYLNVSTKDALTAIENRGALEQQVKDLIYKKEDFYLCFIDLNKFKAINDIYGHDAGDEALKFVAEAMQKANPKGLNGRNGGDEFIMIIFDKHEAVMDKFKQLLTKNMKFKEHKIPVSASIGFTQSTNDLLLDDLIKVADENMYSNKKTT